MISWEEYIKANIMKFRELYQKFPKKSRELLKNTQANLLSLSKPTQVVVIDVIGHLPKFFVIIHSMQYLDMETIVYESKTIDEMLHRFSTESPRWMEYTNLSELREYVSHGRMSKEFLVIYKFFEESSFLAVNRDPRNAEPELGNYLIASMTYGPVKIQLDSLDRRKQKKKIERTVNDIKQDAKTISEVGTRTKVMEKIERLETQIDQLDQKTEQQITRVRQLIGSSETFQDWKILISDVDRLKGEHVPREVFDAKVNELSTRINSLAEIKEAYDSILAQQNEFMKQQSEVMKQQSSFVKWIKYATVFVPIAVLCVPIIEMLLRHFLNIP